MKHLGTFGAKIVRLLDNRFAIVAQMARAGLLRYHQHQTDAWKPAMLKLLDPPAPQDQRQSETALLVARGTRRMLRHLNFSTLTELPLLSGRRADIVALSRNGTIFIVEVKASAADLRFDTQWPDYRIICDRFYFAIPESVPIDLMPENAGLILADAYSADIVRAAPEHPVAPATRRGMLLRFANEAAVRLQRVIDPEANPHGGF